MFNTKIPPFCDIYLPARVCLSCFASYYFKGVFCKNVLKATAQIYKKSKKVYVNKMLFL